MVSLKKLLLILLVSSLFFLYSYLSYVNISDESFASPDVVMNYLFSKNLSSTFSLNYEDSLSEKYEIVGGYGFINTAKGLAPSVMLGYIFILSMFQKISPEIIFLVNPIFQILTLIIFYKFCLLFFKKNISLILLFLFSVSNIFLYGGSLLYKDISLNFFFLLSLYLLVSAIKKDEKLLYSLSGLFLGISSIISYNYFIFAFLFGLVFLSRKKIINLIYFLIPLFFCFLFLLFIFKITYDNIFWLLSKGNVEMLVNLDSNPLSSLSWFKTFIKFDSIAVLLENLTQIIIVTNPVILSLGALGMIELFVNKDINKKVKYLIISSCFFLLFYYCGWKWFGFGKSFSVNSSYSRYLLPFWVLMFFCSGFLIQKIKNKLLISFIIVTVISINIMSIFSNSGTFNELKEYKEIFIKHKNAVLSNTPEGSIIFTKSDDKYFIPYRKAAIYPAIKGKDKNERISNTYLIVSNLLEENKDIFWKREGPTEKYGNIEQSEYFNFFFQNKLKIKKINEYLYEIKR